MNPSKIIVGDEWEYHGEPVNEGDNTRGWIVKYEATPRGCKHKHIFLYQYRPITRVWAMRSIPLDDICPLIGDMSCRPDLRVSNYTLFRDDKKCEQD